MPNQNIANELEQLKSDYEKQRAEKLKVAKEELFKKVTELRDLCKGLPQEVLTDFKGSREKFNLFGELTNLLVGVPLTPSKKDKKPSKRKKRRTRKANAPKVSDDEILAFLDTEKTTKELQDKFGFSSVTVSKRTKQLKSEGKITVRKDGVKKFWKKA